MNYEEESDPVHGSPEYLTIVDPAGESGPLSSRAAPEAQTDLRSTELYLNRELSWLEFNARVLREAESDSVPLLERLKFHAIFASNLDEFFMVRVAGLKQQLNGEVSDFSPDGLTAAQQLNAISVRAHELVNEQYQAFNNQLLPKLAEQGILLVKPDALPADKLVELDARFRAEVFPVLTPIAIDVGHPFPRVRNKSLNLGVMLSKEGTEPGFGVVPVPMMLPRLIDVPGLETTAGGVAKHAYVLLEDLIARNVGTIFPGFRIKGVYTFRVTRNFDLEFDEEEAADLLQTIQQELRRRDRGNAVRLEVAGEPTSTSLKKLVDALKLDPEKDVYKNPWMLNVADLMNIALREERRELRDDPFVQLTPPSLRDGEDVFSELRERDILLYHPYESFEPVVELVNRAAEDPDVLAIKQTLYRAGGDSPIVKALARAAEAGKQVTAVVELKARFDEESNIVWARTLEQSGVQVVFGLVGLKTHAKCLLIVRREKTGLRRYVHVSTGNYNPTTARLYTDVSLLTSRVNICEDASSLFNLLTGYSAPPKWNSLIVAPLGMHEAVLGLINREADHARAGRPARIVAKMNALVDEDVIEALYRASGAGVKMTLLVRGICCLRPNVPGVSENIEVRALVDRFLEHSRIFHFENGGKTEVYIGSADWMPRNFHRRVEIMIPIEDPALRSRLSETLDLYRADMSKSWILRSDGSYVRVPLPGSPTPLPPLRTQSKLAELTRDRVRAADALMSPSNRFFIPTTSPLDSRRDGRKRRERKKNPPGSTS